MLSTAPTASHRLFGYALIAAILASLAVFILFSLLNSLFTSLSSGPAEASGINPLFAFSLIYALIIGVSVFTSAVGGFFIGQGFIYLLARAFGGQGSFTAQAYTALLFQVPIGIVSSFLSVIPFVGSIGSLAGIYGLVLQVFSLMAVHRLSGGKATAIVLIPVAIAALFIIVLVVLYFAFLFSLFNSIPASSQ